MPTDFPKATQCLSPAGLVQRQAECSTHHKLTSEFIGPSSADREVWLFRCTAKRTNKDKADHLFAAHPDRSAPKTPEEVAVWLVAQRAAKAGVPTKSQS